MGACPLARSGAWIGESSEPIGAFRRSRSLRRLLAVATLLVWLPGGAQPAGMASAAFPPAEHDAVVSPLDPLHVRIPAGNVTAARRARVRVWNADTEGTQTIRLAAASIDCPGVRLTSPPSFGAAAPSSPDLVSLAAGESAIARLAIEVNADSPRRESGRSCRSSSCSPPTSVLARMIHECTVARAFESVWRTHSLNRTAPRRDRSKNLLTVPSWRPYVGARLRGRPTRGGSTRWREALDVSAM
jgi:hypothetical protein